MTWRAHAAIVAWPRTVGRCLALATIVVAGTAIADDGSTTRAATRVQTQVVDTTKFEAFVREVGLDMSSLPAELRRQWSEAPRAGIDDCSISGDHAGHIHGPARGEKAVKHPDAVEHRSDG